MDILPQHNFSWMSYNISLAMLPVFFGWFMFLSSRKWVKFILAFFWLIFLPNSIYLFTDIIHIFQQWNLVNFQGKLLLVMEYSLLLLAGLLTYIYGFYPFERILHPEKKLRKKTTSTLVLVSLNFLVAIAVILGRVYRVNSWDLLINFQNVIKVVYKLLLSPELIFITVLFGSFTNLLYFLMRKQVIKYTRFIFRIF